MGLILRVLSLDEMCQLMCDNDISELESVKDSLEDDEDK